MNTVEGRKKTHEQQSEEKYNSKSIVTIKLIVLPSGETQIVDVPLKTTIYQLKSSLAKTLGAKAANLRFINVHVEALDHQSLLELGFGPSGGTLLVRSCNEATHPLPTGIFKLTQRDKIINVNISSGEGIENVLNVEIQDQAYKKPFLGGWKNRKTGTEYLNASTQTNSCPNHFIDGSLESRETQTYDVDSISLQTRVDMCTQVAWKFIGDAYISTKNDHIITSKGHYVTAAEKETMLLQSVITLQKHWRAWLAKRAANKERKIIFELQDRLKMEKDLADTQKRMREKEKQKSQLYPKTKEDFEIVYSNLNRVIKMQIAELQLRKSGPELKAGLCEVLEQENKILFQIDGHRVIANKAARNRFINFLMNKASTPLSWAGGHVSVHNCDTLQARLHQQLYQSLTLPDLSTEEWQDILTSLKCAVENWKSSNSIELESLIDRKFDLLSRGVKGQLLHGLKSRMLTLYASLLKDPKFNPGVKRIPLIYGTESKDKMLCVACGRSLHKSLFDSKAHQKLFPKCTLCLGLENEGISRVDFNPYRRLLKDLRESEGGKGAHSSPVFHMEDMRVLVDQIWKTQSAISGSCNLDDLRLPRWDKLIPWSPWNCVLLTRDEDCLHQRLDVLEESYADSFRHDVLNKHVTAKIMFPHLQNFAFKKSKN